MSLKVGIVGLPNVGKSTLFEALTQKKVGISNFAFTTIDPNVGVVEVPDERLSQLAKISHSAKIVPTTIEFVDIAGLIKGASEGEGLGNQFLAHIREVDLIVHVVRVFESESINHVHGKIDSAEDIEIIETELELADLQTKEKRAKKEKGADNNLPELDLLSQKKVIFALNASEDQIKANWQPNATLQRALAGRPFVVLSANFELLLAQSSIEEKELYLTDLGLEQSRLNGLIKKAYDFLNLITFFSTGETETHAWTAPAGMTLPKSSRAIHTDFEKKFIRAEVINWQKLVETGSWLEAKTKGLIQLVGRDYLTQDGDVVDIKI
ncbi:MAG: redox-regulated ATPase YchF [Candidatus Yanofskybacteria bacterium CG10_big_fil_rev_8_21_14_0_10_46_23]|uniref:Redox-regulated ATPase YchF n=1 Tax=Candidatus Yanofskybacteria bacterium CG10_big_fil_rev_8_21_14_0_10_46_23 TaxID=1975098 RepID=A0A2H0R507_9BACT|nr:MAG: redox-regulated ATPase YchF [Candidatus Yanofskybacteria bacterium CG10_big_fil_rev_8_21_14_0_10_46_23]